MEKAEKELSIYIHIPFCVRKCLYCDFLSAPATEEVRDRYVKRLAGEIREAAASYVNYKVKTVFLGGGTPSLLNGNQIREIMDAVHCFPLEEDCEISMEVNPGTVTAEKLCAYQEAGVGRLSIGLQSLIDEELQALGRIHTCQDFYDTYECAVKTGFNNINIDLMTAIPLQTMESCMATLKGVVLLNPPPAHISAYSLIVEEGTPFFENTPLLPDEETDREMYKITNDILKKAGYNRYEISNYARPGYACRHNQVYWRRGNYLGFGIGAASLMENVRFSNGRDLKEYLEKGPVKENIQRLTVKEQMEEFMFLGLRLMEGVSTLEFYRSFGQNLYQVYPGIVEKYAGQGLLKVEKVSDGYDERISLTERGIDVSNVIMADFLFT